MSFWSKVNRKARKRHRCDWCGGLILIGENYSHQSGMTSDGFNALKFDQGCAGELQHTLNKEHISEYEDIQEVFEIFKDQYADAYHRENKDDETSSGVRG